MLLRRGAVALVVALSVVLVPAVAHAAPDTPNPQTGPPNGESAHVYCAVNVSEQPVNGVSGTFVTDVKCNYGPTYYKLRGIQVNWRTNGTSVSGSNAVCGYKASAGSGNFYAQPHPGSFECRGTTGFTPNANTGTWPTTISNGTNGGCNIGWFSLQLGTGSAESSYYTAGSEGATTNAGTGVELSCSVGMSPPAYPSPYWPGGAGGTYNGGTGVGGGAPGFDESAPPGDTTGGDEDCGAWYHIACHLRNALRAVFVPDPGFMSDQWDVLHDALADNWPTGPIVWVGDGVANAVTSVLDAIGTEPGSGIPGCEGPSLTFTFVPTSGSETTISPFGTCSGQFGEDIAPIVRTASTIGILLAVLGAMVQLARMLGIGARAPGVTGSVSSEGGGLIDDPWGESVSNDKGFM